MPEEARRGSTPDPIVVPAPDAEHPVRITYAAHTYPRFEEVAYLSTGDSLTIGVGLPRLHRHRRRRVLAGAAGQRRQHASCAPTPTSWACASTCPVGPGLVNFVLDDVPLLDGTFTYSVGVLSKGGVLFDWRSRPGRSTS